MKTILRNLWLALLFATAVHAGAIQVFSNNGVTTLAAAATPSATTLTVSSNSAFPSLSGGNWFIATLEHLVSGIVTAQEIVKVTAVSGDTFTVVRAQEGTAALSWSSGDTLALLPTAGGLAQFTQPAQVQVGTYNYAIDTGSANAYTIALTPAITSASEGLQLRWTAAHTNTGASTLNAGFGAQPVLRPNGTAMVGGEIYAGGVATVVWHGSSWQLVSPLQDTVVLNPYASGLQSINGPLQVGPTLNISGASVPYLSLTNTSAGANTGVWLMQDDPTMLVLEACPDSLSGCSSAITVNRTTSTVTSVQLGGTAQTGTTQAASDNSTNLATTAYVTNGIATLNSALAPQLTNLQTGVGSTTIAYQPSGVTGITTGLTAIINEVNLVASATYAVAVSAPITYNSSTSNTLTTRVCYVVGTTCTQVTTVGGGVNFAVEGPTTGSNDNVVFGNAANMTGMSIFNSSSQNVSLQGEFTMPSTSSIVTFEMAVSTGTLTVGAGAYVQFTRIN